MSSQKVFQPAWKFRKLTSQFLSVRTFLSAAYRCDDAWNNRLSSSLLKNIKTNEYLFELDKKFRQVRKVSAIDVDLIVNSLNSSSVQEIENDIEQLLIRLRRSPETIHTLPSTPHAILRLLLDARKTELLLKFLDNPLQFGIFPDHYASNLLMDTYLEEKNFTAAARVASKLMLQEDFGPPVTQALAIASCYSYINNEEKLPWEDFTMKLEEPEEEVKIRIKYLRNPYFDDHFDLKEPDHIVGKTLAWGSPLIGGNIGRSCEVLGWALYNKWDTLAIALNNILRLNKPIAASVLNLVKEIIIQKDKEVREEILPIIRRLESDSLKVVEVDLESLIHDVVQQEVAKAEANDISSQEQIYASWEKKREEEVQNQLLEYKKRKLMAEIEEKKKMLKAKEDLLYFFKNKDKLTMLVDKKPEKVEEDRIYFFPRKKKSLKEEDEVYVPPSVYGN